MVTNSVTEKFGKRPPHDIWNWQAGELSLTVSHWHVSVGWGWMSDGTSNLHWWLIWATVCGLAFSILSFLLTWTLGYKSKSLEITENGYGITSSIDQAGVNSSLTETYTSLNQENAKNSGTSTRIWRNSKSLVHNLSVYHVFCPRQWGPTYLVPSWFPSNDFIVPKW